jgi:hypothetical protein
MILLSIAVAVVFHYFSGDLTGGLCSNQIHKAYLSPNRSLKAVVFQRECGPSNGATIQVSVVDASKDLENKAGNILVIKGEAKNSAPKIAWNNDQELVIYHPLNGNEFRAETQYGSNPPINIVYEL